MENSTQIKVNPPFIRTGTLHSSMADDWSAMDKEEWEAEFLGDCNMKKLHIR